MVAERTAAGDVPVWYVRTPSGELLYALHWYNDKLLPAPYVKDHLGSVRKVMGPRGGVANTYEYDPYGQLTESSRTLRNAFTFTGYQFDEGVGLYYAKARYYQPSQGRFLSQDTYLRSPWAPWTQHLYGYVGGNPVNWVDPTGHWGTRTINPDGGSGDSSTSAERGQKLLEAKEKRAQEAASAERIANAHAKFNDDRESEWFKGGPHPDALCGQAQGMTTCAPVPGHSLPSMDPSDAFGCGIPGYPYDCHYGMDVGVDPGTDVLSVAGGTVLFIKTGCKETVRGPGQKPLDVPEGWCGSNQFGRLGNHVAIQLPNGTVTVFGHLSAVSVQVGDNVAAGQVIGRSGNTGNSFGGHLHWEWRVNGKATDPYGLIGWWDKRAPYPQ